MDVMHSVEDSWISRLFFNLLGYASVLGPGFILLRYLEKKQLFQDDYRSLKGKVVNYCLRGSPLRLDVPSETSGPGGRRNRTLRQKMILLISCFAGLQAFYLTWGVLQEKIMTRTYQSMDGKYVEMFKDSQFIVLVNRVLAFAFAFIYILFTQQPPHRAPLYKYSYCSFSNVMSSWCQYEALKYVSFPTQVLSKATKIIPVMLMGKIVSKKSYPTYEYVIALFISLGMFLFLMNSSEPKHSSSNVTTASGYVILAGYMLFDSFTGNWQSELFQVYRVSSFQMMCGVNMFSCILLMVSLIQTGSLFSSLSFIATFPMFFWDCLLLSICSAGGQFFIFFTIAEFGPVVFVIISTVRQILSILLSVVIYGHDIAFLGLVGIAIVFTSVFVKTYAGYRQRSVGSKKSAVVSSTPPSSGKLQKSQIV